MLPLVDEQNVYLIHLSVAMSAQVKCATDAERVPPSPAHPESVRRAPFTRGKDLGLLDPIGVLAFLSSTVLRTYGLTEIGMLTRERSHRFWRKPTY